jgi:hypothetical protein
MLELLLQFYNTFNADCSYALDDTTIHRSSAYKTLNIPFLFNSSIKVSLKIENNPGEIVDP